MKNELYHYGVSGQKWGVRRYQNGDGSYTSEGKKRYKKSSSSKSKKKAILSSRLLFLLDLKMFYEYFYCHNKY